MQSCKQGSLLKCNNSKISLTTITSTFTLSQSYQEFPLGTNMYHGKDYLLIQEDYNSSKQCDLPDPKTFTMLLFDASTISQMSQNQSLYWVGASAL